MAKYADVIAINHYNRWEPGDSTMTNWVSWTGKPFLISEFYIKASSTGKDNKDGAGDLVTTQKERGYWYQNFTLKLLESRGCVGWHWHRFADQESGTSGSNKGFFTYDYKPYTDLTTLATSLNNVVYDLIDFYDGAPTTTYPLTVTSGSGSGSFQGGQTVTITAKAAPAGQVFSQWVVNSGTPVVTSATSVTTTLKMPASSASVTATYKNSSTNGTLYEAERYSGKSGCSVDSNHSGYTGSGFVDMGGSGTWFQNTIVAASAGNYTLSFRYANASSSSRPCTILVNGVSKGTISFASTGSWDRWGTASITVSLIAGNNTIRVKANTSAGGPNVDSITVK